MDGGRSDALQQTQLHEAVCQEPQCPAGLTSGRVTAAERDQVRLDLAGDLIHRVRHGVRERHFS